jgi:hypothetical protein
MLAGVDDMKRNKLSVLLAMAFMVLGSAAAAEDGNPCGIKTDVKDNGTVELSNTENTVKCDAPAAAQGNPPVTAPAGDAEKSPADASANASGSGTAASSAPAAADGQADQADSRRVDPQQQYRDAMLQGAPGTTAANPAVSRRYKMMNKETYKAMVLDAGAPGSAAGTAPSQ